MLSPCTVYDGSYGIFDLSCIGLFVKKGGILAPLSSQICLDLICHFSSFSLLILHSDCIVFLLVPFHYGNTPVALLRIGGLRFWISTNIFFP